MKPCSWLLTNPALLVLQRVQLVPLNGCKKLEKIPDKPNRKFNSQSYVRKV
jgi:hypothetical protein